jgi:hypothetical protein
VSIEGETARYVDLSASGLLWLINTALLHPRGYALAVEQSAPTMMLLLGDGREPVTFADSMHETVIEKFNAVEALLEPRDVTALTGDGAPVLPPLPPTPGVEVIPDPAEVFDLPPTPGVEHHEGTLHLTGTGGAFEPSEQFQTVEGEQVRFGVEVEDGPEEFGEGTAEGELEHPEDAVDLPVEEEK